MDTKKGRRTMATAMLNARGQEVDANEGLGADDIVGRSLLSSGCFVLNGDIDSDSIGGALRWLVHENNKSERKVLTLYINSVGGYIDDAFALIDLMRHSHHTIRTVGLGQVMSSAFMIFIAGTQGHRYIGQNALILSHQYSDELEGKHHDIKSYMKAAEATNNRMINLVKETTGLTTSVIKRKLFPPSDVWLTPDEAVALNIADYIL